MTAAKAPRSTRSKAQADVSPAPVADDPKLRVLKKYPNRRLYDTATSSYVTLAEAKKLVMQAVPLVVRDAKTGEDLTRSILLQIILEEEASGSPIFTEQVLANIIRFYGHAMQGFFGANLENSIQAFADMQKKMMESANSLSMEGWQKMTQEMMQNYTVQSSQALQQMQKQFHANMQHWLSAFQPKR